MATSRRSESSASALIPAPAMPTKWMGRASVESNRGGDIRRGNIKNGSGTRLLGYSATRLLGYSVIQQRKYSSRDVLCRVWAGSFACPASETLELGGGVEEAGVGPIEPLDGGSGLRK